MKLNLSRKEEYTPTWAPLILRLALGTVFIAHGSQLLFGAFGGPGIKGVIGMTSAMGFVPAAFWAWMLALTQFLGGLGILVGLLTRLASVGIVTVMLVAFFKVHLKNGFFLPTGFEFVLVLAAIAISLIISGAGKLSLDWYISQWRKDRADHL